MGGGVAVEVVACSGAAVAMAVALVAALVARKSTSTVRFYQGKTRFHFLQPETMKRTGERIWQEFLEHELLWGLQLHEGCTLEQ